MQDKASILGCAVVLLIFTILAALLIYGLLHTDTFSTSNAWPGNGSTTVSRLSHADSTPTSLAAARRNPPQGLCLPR